MVGRDGARDVLQHDGLAGPGRRHDQSALSHADRRDQVDHPWGEILAVRFRDRLEVFHFHLQATLREERRQIVEVDPRPDRLGGLEIDRADLEQREISFAVTRRADLPLDRVPGPQSEPSNLCRTDIDVVRSGQIVRLRAPQEAEPVRHDLERALAMNGLVVLGEILEDREHDVLLAQARRVLDLE